MAERELDEGMVRVELVVDEKSLMEIQALLDASTPSEAMRILISNRLAEERAKREEKRARRPRREAIPEGPPPEFAKRAPSEEEWKERRETRGERRWRKAGPLVETPPAREEHPIRAYQRRVEAEEERKQRARRGGALGYGAPPQGRGPQGGRPGGRPGAGRPGGPAGGERPPYGNRAGGGERPYGARPGGERPAGRSYGERPSGGRPPYGGGRPGGSGRPAGGGRPGGRPSGGGGRPPRGR